MYPCIQADTRVCSLWLTRVYHLGFRVSDLQLRVCEYLYCLHNALQTVASEYAHLQVLFLNLTKLLISQIDESVGLCEIKASRGD